MASTYNARAHDSSEERRLLAENPVPLDNQLSAAFFVVSLLIQGGYSYALIGGINLQLMGSQRELFEVDIVTDGAMDDVWALLEGEYRVILPNPKVASDAINAYVRTGPDYDDCERGYNIRVNIFPAGSGGAPQDFTEHTVALPPVRVWNLDIQVKGLEPFQMLKLMLRQFAVTGDARSFEHIRFLIDTFGDMWRSRIPELDGVYLRNFLDSLSDDEREAKEKVLGL